jgi:hypothetical protein
MLVVGLGGVLAGCSTANAEFRARGLELTEGGCGGGEAFCFAARAVDGLRDR